MLAVEDGEVAEFRNGLLEAPALVTIMPWPVMRTDTPKVGVNEAAMDSVLTFRMLSHPGRFPPGPHYLQHRPADSV